MRNYGVLDSSIHGQREVLKFPDSPAAAGDLISIRAGGGGGWGDPFDRDPEAVLRDVLDGYVTVDAARSEYGVAINQERSAIDQEETSKLRS
jgi:N-methylhydantoinase B